MLKRPKQVRGSLCTMLNVRGNAVASRRPSSASGCNVIKLRAVGAEHHMQALAGMVVYVRPIQLS